MIRGLHHCAIVTEDLERSVAFYCSHFGFERVLESGWERGYARVDAIVGLKDTAARFVMIGNGTDFIEIFHYSSPERAPETRLHQANDPGFAHICFEVDDIDAEYKRLLAVGMHFHTPPPLGSPNGVRSTYGRDPDGNIVELLQIIDANHPFRRKET